MREVIRAVPEIVSIELTRRCSRACRFCYNASGPKSDESWLPQDVVTLARALVPYGLRALTLGGGEPLEYAGLDELFRGLAPLRQPSSGPALFVSVTTNGLLLDRQMARISDFSPDKTYVSIHEPSCAKEVSRVIRQVLALRRIGLVSGVNLLVRRSELDESAAVRTELWRSGITNDAITYLPMRGQDTPTPEELGRVAGGPFQTMTCVRDCAPSPRFASVGADRTIAYCSYTQTRRTLESLDAAGVVRALDGLGLAFCGDDEPHMVAQTKRPTSSLPPVSSPVAGVARTHGCEPRG